MPTLVLVGEDDAITPPDEARGMAGALPDARLEVIPDAGHLAPLENPAACNRAILTFLSGPRLSVGVGASAPCVAASAGAIILASRPDRRTNRRPARREPMPETRGRPP